MAKKIPYGICFFNYSEKLLLSPNTISSVTLDEQQCSSTSVAHERSGFAIVDPAYSVQKFIPAPDLKRDAALWLYGNAELECWRLEVLRKRIGEARLTVAYPGTFHRPSNHAFFLSEIPIGGGHMISLDIRAVGRMVVSVDDREIYRGEERETSHQVVFPKDLSGDVLRVLIRLATKEEPPALLIENGLFTTGQAPWRWSPDGLNFSTPRPFPATQSGIPPHRVELSQIELSPVGKEGELYDMGCLVLGYISFSSPGTPALFAGESPAEANNSDPRHFEQSTELQMIAPGRWINRTPLAFRYFRIAKGEATNVKCLALLSPARYRGAFACSDETLTRIWMVGAYTLRLCLHDFLIDGVKRDRLPWVGDLAMSLMANACVFGDGEIVRRSLVALGRAGISQTHLNGIVDYSMWWIIAQDLYQLFYGDADHLGREWSRIRDTLERLTTNCDVDGLYVITPKDWVFIDWVEEDKQTALQIVWWWTLMRGAALACRRRETEMEVSWRGKAAALEKTLLARAFDRKELLWRGRLDGTSDPSRHANIFAVVSGLADVSQYPAVCAAILGQRLKPVGTPYVAGFENIALAKLAESAALQERVKDCWGGMLKRGASTFWEAWDPKQTGDDAYAFYGRPFAKSLCHAWSAGPTAILPLEICGIRPKADGWTQFSVAPKLGTLAWACATVPTPFGEIEATVDAQRLRLRVPQGSTAIWNGRVLAGPGLFELER